tara:strand:- start:51 stop:2396 length:2346 start_codon:yes stop_codon:yes gene_type:complete
MTGKEGGTFIFGGVKFDTPPNSNVFYDADNGELKLEKGSEIKEFSDFEKGKGIRIFGNDVKITNDIFLKYGRIRITKRGYFINGYGGVIYKQIFVRDFSKQGVLIANPSIDLSNEDINYIRQTDNTLELKSCSDLNCDLNAEILENNEILNTDYNDKLVFHVAKGDSLIINKGLNGKPPKILRKGDWHGFSRIRNDGIGFNIDDRGMSMWDNFFTYEDLEKGRFQSVAFEMEFDSDEMINNKLIIDSSSKFSMISRNGEERVVFEKQGIPKSLLNMNQEQTNNLINNLDKASPQMRELVESNIDVALREYDGENFEEIEQGVKITSKYAKRSIYNSGLSNLVGVAKKGGFKFTKIKNKEDLIQEYTASLNSYFEYPESLNNYEISKIAVTINKLHDNEGLIDGTDNMREQIARDLSFKAKYNLIAISNADLYQSTFDKLYNNFPKDSIKEIKGIDPNGEYWADFAIQIGERDKLNDLLKQDPGFLVDAVDKGISISDPRKVEESTASLANTFIEFYENPEYSDEKKYFEERLVRLYENTDTLDKKASYSYLIKLNEQSSNPEFKNIYNSLPELPDVSVPKCSGDVCTGKQYFYSDENWFDITLNDYTNKEGIYQFDIIKKTDDTAILEKNLQNGKTMRMILTTDNSDASEVLKDDETIFVGHRGHSYNSKETFKGSSDKKKIIFDGGCGGPGRVVEIQKQYPNAQVIYDKNTGEGAVNQYEAYKILRRVTLGETEWNKIRDNTEDKKGIILPNEKNQLMIRYKTLVKRDIERQEDSRYASR